MKISRAAGRSAWLPGPVMTGAQIALSFVDWALAAAVFHALLPATPA